MKIVPCTQKLAKQFVKLHHRHHKPPLGAIFCIAVIDDEGLVRGVATVGRPVARYLDDGYTVEVNRVATDGCDNACSALLAGTRRVAFAMGYSKVVTYTLKHEGGGSLRGAGWVLESEEAGGSIKLWHSRKGRKIENEFKLKNRWSTTNSKANRKPVIWPEAEAEDQLSMFDDPDTVARLQTPADR